MEIRPAVNPAPNMLDAMHRAAQNTAVQEPSKKTVDAPPLLDGQCLARQNVFESRCSATNL